MLIAMEQYKNDQFMTLSYDQENHSGKTLRSYGFTFMTVTNCLFPARSNIVTRKKS